MTNVRLPCLVRALVMATLSLSWAASAQASTVVETQRIIVPVEKPLEGQAPALTPPPPAAATGFETHRPGEESLLPAPVAAMRRKILDAAYSGDMEKIHAIIQTGETLPVFSVNEITDPIDFLKKQSGDGRGLEILAIMTDVLEGGFAHVDAGKPTEMYVFPYYAVLPTDKLTPSQLVDVYKLVTSGDFEEMKNSGSYSFYALGIGADGSWRYFKPQE